MFWQKENVSKHTGSQKASGLVEEKIKKLKKRNSELVSIARQLEEKAKQLQEEKNATLVRSIIIKIYESKYLHFQGTHIKMKMFNGCLALVYNSRGNTTIFHQINGYC